MQTEISAKYLETAQGREADEILRKCVHCGFCTATCPTYQLLNDELDGPRGRIYQIKLMLEGQPVSDETLTHLDRCLTCRSCETTCPSGVEYGRLLDYGRYVVERQISRPLPERLVRFGLERVLSSAALSRLMFSTARIFRPLLPGRLAGKIPPRQVPIKVGQGTHTRRMLILDGCVQPTLTPRTNQAAKQLLQEAGIALVSAANAGCCGALSHHLSYHERAEAAVKRNIDAWWPEIEAGAEAIVVTASGCGVMVKDYGHFLRGHADYAEKAERISQLVKDLSEIVSEHVVVKPGTGRGRRIAFHSPCTYQHGLRLGGKIESLLADAGYELCPVSNPHLCCGSAGSYSLLQPDISSRLLTNKVESLEAGKPELIATANVGCQTHLMSGTRLPVVHWVELLI